MSAEVARPWHEHGQSDLRDALDSYESMAHSEYDGTSMLVDLLADVGAARAELQQLHAELFKLRNMQRRARAIERSETPYRVGHMAAHVARIETAIEILGETG